jgi:hypothetical protein
LGLLGLLLLKHFLLFRLFLHIAFGVFREVDAGTIARICHPLESVGCKQVTEGFDIFEVTSASASLKIHSLSCFGVLFLINSSAMCSAEFEIVGTSGREQKQMTLHLFIFWFINSSVPNSWWSRHFPVL